LIAQGRSYYNYHLIDEQQCKRDKQISFTRGTDLVKSDRVDMPRSHLSKYNEVEMGNSLFTQYTRSQVLYGRGNLSLYCPSSTEVLSLASSETFEKIFVSSFLALYFVHRRGKEISTVDTWYKEYSAKTYKFKPLQHLLSDSHVPGALSSQYKTMADGPGVTATLFSEDLRCIVHL